MAKLTIPPKRHLDLITIGRLSVDIYAQQYGAPLEDVRSFAKYLGGSSANIAFATARLGLSTAIITKVGDEHFGRFLVNTLSNVGCDTSQIEVDKERLSALAILGIKDRQTFPLIFYRENCADLSLNKNNINEQFIAQARAVLITGTVFANPNGFTAAQKAFRYARKHKSLRVLDIDYRPVLWGLTCRGDGETRYIANEKVTTTLQKILPICNIIIGTEEEFIIAGGVPNNIIASLQAVRQLTPAHLVLKLGELGCVLIEADAPQSLSELTLYAGEKVNVKNVLGAGDAFAGGLMFGILRGYDYKKSLEIANICGAIVVSRHACAPAMPTLPELTYWLECKYNQQVFDPERLDYLHRVTPARKQWNELFVLAFDHRQQFFALAQATKCGENKIIELKMLLTQAVEKIENECALQGKVGVLIDSQYGADALAFATGKNWWVGRPVEKQLSRPLCFENISLASEFIRYPNEHILKCLVYYHPDDPANLRIAQEEKLLELWQATRKSGHELLLEVIVPPNMANIDEQTINAHNALYPRIIRRFYNLGLKPEWWKLPPLLSQTWEILSNEINRRDPYCRGIVILGLDQPIEVLAQGFSSATNPLIKGFMVGRSLWREPSLAWMKNECNDGQLINQVINNFKTLLNFWNFQRK